MVEITGLGGMGKSTLATEYCQRYYGSFYPLVVQVSVCVCVIGCRWVYILYLKEAFSLGGGV